MMQITTWLSREKDIEVCVLYSRKSSNTIIHSVLNETGNFIPITLDEKQGIIEEIILNDHGLIDDEYFYYQRDNCGETDPAFI